MIKYVFDIVIHKYGIYPDIDTQRRLKIIQNYRINKLIDIGANEGQYSTTMRRFGFDEKIISFEPLKDAFIKLQKISANDKNWKIYNYGFGSSDFKGVINVSANSQSSSLLNILPLHTNIEPNSKYIAQQPIEIKRLDSVFDSFFEEGDIVMIKIDTQGSEKNVLEGAEKSLQKIRSCSVRNVH